MCFPILYIFTLYHQDFNSNQCTVTDSASMVRVNRLLSTLPSHDGPVVRDFLAYWTPGAATWVQQQYGQALTGEYSIQSYAHDGKNRLSCIVI